MVKHGACLQPSPHFDAGGHKASVLQPRVAWRRHKMAAPQLPSAPQPGMACGKPCSHCTGERKLQSEKRHFVCLQLAMHHAPPPVLR